MVASDGEVTADEVIEEEEGSRGEEVDDEDGNGVMEDEIDEEGDGARAMLR